MESWKDEWPEGSQWYMDRQTNTLLALTTPEMHERLEDMLDIMDTVPIQVLVRTKYIEIKAEDMTEAGLGMLFLRSSYDASDLEQTSMLQGQMSFRRAYKVSEGTQIMLDLVALQQQGRAKLLSAPEVIAMNNNSATIDISKRFSYASQYSAASSLIQNPGGGTTQIPAAYMPSQFVDVDVGFLLEFVPSVGRDMKHIVLDLHSRVDDVSNIDDFSSAPFILPASGDSGSAAAAVLAAATSKGVPRPIVDSREFRTRLVVEDGGTIVIGGLLKNNRDVVNRRVPILGDIPLLGLLFRYKKESIKQSNLIIVIQAKIITPDGRTYRKETPAGTGTIGSATPDGEWILDLPPDEESGPPGYGRLPSSLPGRRATGAR